MDISSAAKKLDNAAKMAVAVPQLSKTQSFTLEEAYEIQKRSIDLRLERGEKLVGFKMGFTSLAKMEQMGVHDMIWGRLTDEMYIKNGNNTPISRYIHPRAEPEICFRIRKTIDKAIPVKELPDYVDGVAAAIEIIDSRYEDFKFSLEDVIADNCSSSGFVIGDWHPASTPIQNVGITVLHDNKSIAYGSSAAILDNPWKALEACTRLTSQYGQIIPKGSIILAGAATGAAFIKEKREIKIKVDRLGEVFFTLSR